MIAATLIGIAAASSLILATAARRRSLVATLLLAYLAYVGNLGIVTLVLSPLREVTRGGIAVVELAVLGASLAIWWEQGRPAIPLASAWASLREVACDPLSTLFGLGVGALLSYELLLALVAPVIRWDSLSYHLTRAAAWAQHGGLYWITNAPDVRLNAFQPLAEQQILFLFVATGRGALSSLPQYLAELAILLACYGAARRLGHGVRPAACGAFLFATFSLVAFESTTADNDLVAASLPAVAVYFLLGADLLEPLYAGVAAGFALGVKLTTALVLPIVVWLALARGRRTLALTVGGGAIGFVALGIWGYALNAIHTGHVLGSGTGSW
jgi:hypothetical protein